MAANEKNIYVYDDFSFEKPELIGTLYVNVIKGSESYSFAYDAQWLKKTNLSVYLDPELMPYAGRQYPSGSPFLACLRILRRTVGAVYS